MFISCSLLYYFRGHINKNIKNTEVSNFQSLLYDYIILKSTFIEWYNDYHCK